MIKTEEITINDKKYMKTYSTTGYYIQRDGQLYAEAIDPFDSSREYTETSEKIPEQEISAEAIRIITGGTS